MNNAEIAQAEHLVYMALVRALALRGVLPVEAVTTSLGDLIDERTASGKPVSALTKHYYETLLALEVPFAGQ